MNKIVVTSFSAVVFTMLVQSEALAGEKMTVCKLEGKSTLTVRTKPDSDESYQVGKLVNGEIVTATENIRYDNDDGRAYRQLDSGHWVTNRYLCANSSTPLNVGNPTIVAVPQTKQPEALAGKRMTVCKLEDNQVLTVRTKPDSDETYSVGKLVNGEIVTATENIRYDNDNGRAYRQLDSGHWVSNRYLCANCSTPLNVGNPTIVTIPQAKQPQQTQVVPQTKQPQQTQNAETRGRCISETSDTFSKSWGYSGTTADKAAEFCIKGGNTTCLAQSYDTFSKSWGYSGTTADKATEFCIKGGNTTCLAQSYDTFSKSWGNSGTTADKAAEFCSR
jgi:hypothetical protein